MYNVRLIKNRLAINTKKTPDNIESNNKLFHFISSGSFEKSAVAQHV